MSRIDELIQQLCPDGVEYKPLGEIGTFVRGNGLQKKDFVDHGVGCIHYGQIYTYYKTFATETKSFVSEEKALKLKKAHPGDLIIATTSENTEDVCKAVAWLGKEDICISGDAYVYHHSQNPKYLAYIFQTQSFYDHKKKFATGTKVIRLSDSAMGKFQCPVPPLPVQEEIVRILDKFTALEAELEAELEARRKQYEFYRDQLLTFGDEVEWRPLGEIGDFTYGYTAKAQNQGDVRFIRITDIGNNGCLNKDDVKYITLSDESKKYLLKVGDLLVARTGATFGKTLIITSSGKYVYASFLIKITLDSNLIGNKFYWHFSKSKFYWKQALKLVSASSQPQFNTGALKKILVPVPPLTEQERIVAILDKFDALVNDISSGLPAELEMRRKQYEYYRDRLLTFKPLAKEA